MKLTGWYDGCQKPVRAGLYRRNFKTLHKRTSVLWAYWTGERWAVAASTKPAALRNAHFRSSEQCLPWRGIAGPEL